MELILVSHYLFVWIAAPFILFLLYGIVYRLYLSPIASFPGPKLAALTFGYEFYYDIIHKGQYIWKIKELHQKYGPVVRINPYELHLLDPEFYDKLLSDDRQANKWEWQTKSFGIPQSMLATVDHATHRQRRSVLNQFFSAQRARQLQPVVQERVDCLVERLAQSRDTKNIIHLDHAYAALANGKSASNPEHLTTSTYRTAIDVVMEYSFARHESRIEAPEFDPSWFKMTYEVAIMSPLWRYFHPILVFVMSLPDWVARLLGPPLDGLVLLKQQMYQQIEAIRSGANTSHDASVHSTIFHDILSSKLPDHEKESHRLKDDAQLLIGAGTLTTSWTLTLATFHLLENPSILRRLKDELKTIDPHTRGHLSATALQSLPYFTAVIEEALRLSVGATLRLQRIFPYHLAFEPSKEGQRSWIIPPGTPTSLSVWHLHQDGDIFPDPHVFKPDRWIENPTLKKYQFAFSRGSRGCLGINLAYVELYTCLAAVFSKFGSKEVRDETDIGSLELFGTTIEDVALWGDCFLPVQKPGSLGVRAIISS